MEEGKTIKLFTNPECRDCKQIKRLLNEMKIPFKEYDVYTPCGLAELALLGTPYRKVPLLVIHKDEEHFEVIPDACDQIRFINHWRKDEKKE